MPHPIFEVDMNYPKFYRLRKNESAITTPLGPCVGLALIDQTNSIGGVGHFYDTIGSINDIKTAMAELIGDTDPSGILAIARGAAPLGGGEYVTETLQSRRNIRRILKELNIPDSNTNIHWLPDCFSSARVGLRFDLQPIFRLKDGR